MLEAPLPPSDRPASVGATGAAPAPPRCPAGSQRGEEEQVDARGEGVQRGPLEERDEEALMQRRELGRLLSRRRPALHVR